MIYEKGTSLATQHEHEDNMHLRKTNLEDSRLCSLCSKNNSYFLVSLGNLCSECFAKRYGEIILDKDSAEYYGGDDAHVIAGRFRKHELGHMYLTENHLIFAKEDKDEVSRRWEIIIPLATVVLNWKSEEEERKEYIKWEGTAVDNFGFGSGFLHKVGDQYHMVIPYLDEQGTSQYPRFNVSSASHWAAQLYIKSVKTKMVNPRQNISQNDTPQTISNCFNCTEKSLIYEMIVCAHCNTVFCSMCENNHSIESEVRYHAKYLGGHKLYPKSADTEFFIFSDRIEIPQINLRITYFSMTNIENADEKKISALRVVGLGLVFVPLAILGALWKKRHIYTIIEYVDTSNEQQTLIFDFEGKLEQAQQTIYDKMVLSHSKKKQLLEAKELNQEHGAKSGTLRTGDDPLNILKIRLAKGEITKTEYKETRKIIESQ